MKVTYNTTRTRTLVPVMIDIEDSKTEPSVVVQSKNAKTPTESFTISTQKNGDSYQASFWFEQPGDYAVTIEAHEQIHRQTLQIQSQRFLPFAAEFGFFSLGLIAALGGLILWHKKKIRLNAN